MLTVGSVGSLHVATHVGSPLTHEHTHTHTHTQTQTHTHAHTQTHTHMHTFTLTHTNARTHTLTVDSVGNRHVSVHFGSAQPLSGETPPEMVIYVMV
jgi:carbohydrate-binding DOMON domain-containing protein